MMKTRILLLLTLLCCAFAAMAQTDLKGRIYHNENIMSEQLDKAMGELDRKLDSLRQDTYANKEKEKGRKLTAEEKGEIDKELEEGKKVAIALKKGMKVAISMEFKDERNMVARMKMSIDDAALKAAGVSWAKRKALKLAMAVAPSSDKVKYHQKGNLVIMEDEKEPDTLRVSNDGKFLYGTFDGKTPYKLTRTQ